MSGKVAGSWLNEIFTPPIAFEGGVFPWRAAWSKMPENAFQGGVMVASTNELRIYEVGECFVWEDEESDPVCRYTCMQATTDRGVVLLRLSTPATRDLRMRLRDQPLSPA
jgi:hypothetical protein